MISLYMELLALCELDIHYWILFFFFLLYVAVLYREPDMGCIYYALSERVHIGLAKVCKVFFWAY